MNFGYLRRNATSSRPKMKVSSWQVVSLTRKGGQWLETIAMVVKKGMHAREEYAKGGRALVSHSTKRERKRRGLRFDQKNCKPRKGDCRGRTGDRQSEGRLTVEMEAEG